MLSVMLLVAVARWGWKGIVWPLGLLSGLCLVLSVVLPGSMLTLLAAVPMAEIGR